MDWLDYKELRRRQEEEERKRKKQEELNRRPAPGAPDPNGPNATYGPDGRLIQTGTPIGKPIPPPATPRGRVDPRNPPDFGPDREPGKLEGKGTYESWYTQNKDRWRQPRRSSQYWNGQQGKRPGQTAGNWDYVKGQLKNLGGSSNVRTGAQDIRNYTRHVPGMGEDYAARNASYFTRPGEMEDYFKGNQDYFKTQGQGESWVRGNMGGFEKPGVAETNYGNARDTLKNSSQNTLSYFKDTNPYARGQTLVEGEFDYFQPQLRDKSYSEQMFESGTGGLIDPYARAQEKQTRAIRNAAAARGQFGTGASLRAEEELGADIAASEARDRIALGRSADEMRLGRAGAAQSFSSAAEDAMLGRRGFGLDAASQADASTRENVGLETDAAVKAQDAAINRLFQGGQLGLMADDRQRQRIELGGRQANDAQTQGRGRVTDGMDVTDKGQRLQMDRVKDEVQRILDAAGLEVDADRLDMDTLEQLMRGAGEVDDQYNADTKQDFEIERLLDQDDLTYLESEGNAALTNQNTYENRERNGLKDIQGNARDQSNLVSSSLANASDEDKQLSQDIIQHLIKEAGVSAQQAEQFTESLYRSGQMALYAKMLMKK